MIRKFRYKNPYNGSRTTFRFTWKQAGVYLIKEDDKLVYIGSSSTNLYRTLYRHFERWNHRGQEVVTYFSRLKSRRYSVRVVLCSPSQAERLERALILKYRPRDNENKYSGYQLKFSDQKLVEQYEEAQIRTETPF